MNARDYFEEIRFAAELIAADLVFLLPFAKRKGKFGRKSAAGLVVTFLLSSLFQIAVTRIAPYSNTVLLYFLTGLAYFVVALVSLLWQKWCFEILWSDLFYLGILGYALQHIEYISINEIAESKGYTGLWGNPFFYVTVCVVSSAILYLSAYAVYSGKLRECEGAVYEDSFRNRVFLAGFFLIFFSASMSYQTIFLNTDDAHSFLSQLLDLMSCLLILYVQYGGLRICRLNREKGIIHQLLYERQKQYELEKDNIEILNRKCHDLKHQIAALRDMPKGDHEEYIREMEDSVMIFEAFAKTDNEILNTIITNKSLVCERKNIRLSFMADGKNLDFIREMDLYSLLGNALDNAIECVEQYEDVQKRVITLHIASKGSFLSLNVSNYCDKEPEMENGIPVTTKHEKAWHGFGIKSMKYIVEKYGGSLTISQSDNIFSLQVLIPIP